MILGHGKMLSMSREHAPIPHEENDHEKTSEALRKALAEYNAVWTNFPESEHLLTPELLNRTWQTYWKIKADALHLGREFDVPECDRTTEELIALRKAERGIVLLPSEVMAEENIALMDRLYPGKQMTRKFKDKYQGGGSIDIEMTTEPPHQRTALQGLGVVSAIDAAPSLQGQRVRTYVIASDFSFHMTGQYFTATPKVPCTLPGTYLDSGIVHVSDRTPGDYRFSTGHYYQNGYRTEGRKAA